MSSSSPRRSFESPIASPTRGARPSNTAQRPRLPTIADGAPQSPGGVKTSATAAALARKGSAASITTSIGGTLDTAGPGKIDEVFSNAISTLLTPSIGRTGLLSQNTSATHRAPSARDIPPVTLTSIPHVESSSFKSYLSSVGALYETYQRAKASSDEAATPFTTSKRDQDADYFPSLSRKTSQSSLQSLRRPSAMSPLSPNPPSPWRASRRNAPTPLSTIPNVYFDPDFHLENPRTFDVVSEKSDVIPRPLATPQGNGPGEGTGRKALHTNAILQEKLSWYMDTVEVHLIQAISQASTSFFAALGSLKGLQSEADESIKSIKTLRSTLQDLDNGMAVGGMEIVKMRKRRDNLRRLSQAVSQLCNVVDKAKSCENLVDQGELDEASTALDELQQLITGEMGSGIDLRQLTALKGLSEGIFDLQSRIGGGYESRFVDALLTDLRQHVQSVDPQTTLHRWAHASLRSRAGMVKPLEGSPAYMIPNEKLRPHLTTSLAGLSRSGHTARAATAYREAVMKEIKTMIRRHLPSSSDDDVESITSTSTRGGRKLNQQEKSAVLARNLRSLDPESAEELLVKVYTSVGEALRRLGIQVKVLLDVTLSIEQPKPAGSQSPTKSSTDISGQVMQALDMSSLLGQAVDVVQTQVTKVLKVRAEQSSRLPLQRFLRYFMLNRLFRDECEAISSRPGEAIQQVVNAHVNEFLIVMSEHEKQEIRRVLDSDKWEATEFTARDSIALGRLLQGLDTTPKAWTQFTSLWDQSVVSPNLAASTNGHASNGPLYATIDEQRYTLVTSGTTILHSFDTFLNFSAGVPFMAPEAAARLVEYLKLANSRAVQLILGAGATKSAGLKNITTKHLALASQLCSFVVALIPYAREFIRRQAPSSSIGGALQEFDRVKRLFQDHQTSIHEKLVEIMSARCSAHIKAFKAIDFDAADGKASPSAYVEALAKETGTLHRVLSRHVSEIDLRMVMVPIFAHYNSEWAKAVMEKVSTIKTEAGKSRLLKDMQFLNARLGKMDGAQDLAAQLVRIVEAIVITSPAAASPAAGASANAEKANGKSLEDESLKQDDGKKSSDAQSTAPPTSTSDNTSDYKSIEPNQSTTAAKSSLEILGVAAQPSVSPGEDAGAFFDADAELAAAEAQEAAEAKAAMQEKAETRTEAAETQAASEKKEKKNEAQQASKQDGGNDSKEEGNEAASDATMAPEKA